MPKKCVSFLFSHYCLDLVLTRSKDIEAVQLASEELRGSAKFRKIMEVM